jgi:hypothetical protein
LYIVTINGERIGKNFEQELYDHYSFSLIQPFWEKKRNLTPTAFLSVDWPAINKALTSSPTKTARWITKHATGICGTNNNLLRWKQRDDDLCPRCNQPETTLHVWLCTGHGAGALWTTLISELESWLSSQNTAPTLQAVLLHHLNSWIFKIPATPTARSFIETSQDFIGWDYILEGVFSVEWARIQQKYLDSLGMRSTGHQWLVRLIKRLWQIAWTIWSHRNDIAAASNNKRKNTQLNHDLTLEIDSASTIDHTLTIPSDLVAKIPTMSQDSKKAWIANIRAHKKIKLFHPSHQHDICQMQKVMHNFLSR